MKVAIVQGTRPEIIKNYSIVGSLRSRHFDFEVFHTGQHFDQRMAGTVYEGLGYAPTRTLPQPYQLGKAIDWLQQLYKSERIEHVIVNGDTAASIAGALAAMYLDIDVSHVEAGLRSRDRFMLEERNRIMVDAIASNLFAYTSHELAVLEQSPDIRGNIYQEGNTTIDLLHDFRHRISSSPIKGPYIFVTAHRKELTDSKQRLSQLITALERVASETCRVVFPIHPRTLDALTRFGLADRVESKLLAMDPMTTFDALASIKHAGVVVTDSGCVQEEAYILGVPCVTVRNNTERHLTVKHGANILVGHSVPSILRGISWGLARARRPWPSIYGAPGAGARIVNRITAGPTGAAEEIDVLDAYCAQDA